MKEHTLRRDIWYVVFLVWYSILCNIKILFRPILVCSEVFDESDRDGSPRDDYVHLGILSIEAVDVAMVPSSLVNQLFSFLKPRLIGENSMKNNASTSRRCSCGWTCIRTTDLK
jgi:hypothetical protein